MNGDGEGEKDIGRRGNFILKRGDGRVEVYTAVVVAESETHYRVKLRDGKETDLLKTDLQKIEWLSASSAYGR